MKSLHYKGKWRSCP